MALADQGLDGHSLLFEHGAAEDAVADIGLGAGAVDAGCGGADDADVVQQRGTGHTDGVRFMLRMELQAIECLAGHQAAVGQQQPAQL